DARRPGRPRPCRSGCHPASLIGFRDPGAPRRGRRAPALPGSILAARRHRATLADLLLELAHNGWLGTGPFRVTALDPGRRATFAANEDYWGGRPFLDAIDV